MVKEISAEAKNAYWQMCIHFDKHEFKEFIEVATNLQKLLKQEKQDRFAKIIEACIKSCKKDEHRDVSKMLTDISDNFAT